MLFYLSLLRAAPDYLYGQWLVPLSRIQQDFLFTSIDEVLTELEIAASDETEQRAAEQSWINLIDI